MTEPNREENARAEMHSAEEALLAADALLGLGLWKDAVSRAYYVAFHAACALLVRLGQQARTHRGVRSLLEKHLVAPGLLAVEELARLSRLEERRSVADYRATEQISDEQARALVGEARAFLEAARGVLGSLPK